MPIEIRELVIKATVNSKRTQHASSNRTNGESEALINEIVDKVFRILKQKAER
jgi:hypothetical protein